MPRVFEYYTRFGEARAGFGGLPAWARFLLTLAALPGLVLAGLSVLAFVVSLAALLLLTLPLYGLLKVITGQRQRESSEAGIVGSTGDSDSPGRKRVEATVIE